VGDVANVATVADALDEGVGSPGRATLITGPRGTGKTVVLASIANTARERGWWVIAETASPGMIDRFVTDHLPAALDELNPTETRSRLKSVTAPLGLGGAAWDRSNPYPRTLSFRSLVAMVADEMDNRGSGLLLTVDEVHGGNTGELRELANVIQHGFTEGRAVAFAAAGLPAATDQRLLQDQVITFLRRADRHSLNMLTEQEAYEALSVPIRESGRYAPDDVIQAMVNASRCYPFAVQLVGYETWRNRRDAPAINLDDVNTARPIVDSKLGQMVYEPALADLSQRDRDFVHAMAIDDGPSSLADLANRLNENTSYTSQYRARLLAAEVIVSTSRGYVDFELPHLRTISANEPSPTTST
jgi:hypothetical protein